MRREYDVFEKFSDGSTLWRATVLGRFEASRKMQELGEYSENEFFSIDVQTPKPLAPKPLAPRLMADSQPSLRRAGIA